MLDRRGAGFDREARGGFAGGRDAALPDAGALSDPLVGGVDASLEVEVREAVLGDRATPTRDARVHCCVPSLAQATRSQATG